MRASPFVEQKFIAAAGLARGLPRTELSPPSRSLRVYVKHLEYMSITDNITMLRIVRRGAVRTGKTAPLTQRLASAACYLASKRYIESLRNAIDHALAA